MLHLALNVHRLLINATQRQQQTSNQISLDHSFIGSTILAGDYCFSRAAQMAAQTEHPQVVATFALALQSVSEGLLRQQFPQTHQPDPQNDTNHDANYDEMRQLLQSGANAAALLVDLPANQREQAITLSHDLATYWAHPTTNAPTHPLPEQWQTLYLWLNRQRTHRQPPPTPLN
jgi:octaprenyl-diphosphate synthase